MRGFEEYLQGYRRLSVVTYFMFTIETWSLSRGLLRGLIKSVRTFFWTNKIIAPYYCNKKAANILKNHTLTESTALTIFRKYLENVQHAQPVKVRV
jgi:hypothetical protein